MFNVQETSQRRLANVSSMPHLSRVSSINLTMMSTGEPKKKRNTSAGGTSGAGTAAGGTGRRFLLELYWSIYLETLN